jgi:hypothetical protein
MTLYEARRRCNLSDATIASYPDSTSFTVRFMTDAKLKSEDDASNGKAPYYGMTGTQLNIWITVACTTAMTLFGEKIFIDTVLNQLLIRFFL